MRSRHPVRPKFQVQSRSPSDARNNLRALRGRPLRRRVDGFGEVPEKGVVRQRHSSPLFQRQVRTRVH